MSVDQKLLVGLASIVIQQSDALMGDGGYHIADVHMYVQANNTIYLALVMERETQPNENPNSDDVRFLPTYKDWHQRLNAMSWKLNSWTGLSGTPVLMDAVEKGVDNLIAEVMELREQNQRLTAESVDYRALIHSLVAENSQLQNQNLRTS